MPAGPPGAVLARDTTRRRPGEVGRGAVPAAWTGGRVRRLLRRCPPPSGRLRAGRTTAEPAARATDRPRGRGVVATGRLRAARPCETIERGPGETVTGEHVTSAARRAWTTGPPTTAERLRAAWPRGTGTVTRAGSPATTTERLGRAGLTSAVTWRHTRSTGATTTTERLGRARPTNTVTRRHTRSTGPATKRLRAARHVPAWTTGPATSAKGLGPPSSGAALVRAWDAAAARGATAAPASAGCRAGPDSAVARRHVAWDTAATRRATRSPATACGVRPLPLDAAWHVRACGTAAAGRRARTTGPTTTGEGPVGGVGTVRPRDTTTAPATATECLRRTGRGLGRRTTPRPGLTARHDRGCDHRRQAARGRRSARRHSAPPRRHGTGHVPATGVVPPALARRRLAAEAAAGRPAAGCA
ncbi:hypothetical protein Ais01nite_82250 [Asanoa ishikariensis]|uniref:hypothetical protein n=1 Tax=Asanoa ishikariensis TaxID=137265 RepID=UPI000B850955|nr:hypothetical protein [Asanoa ishikariensis]GIF70190.1 hypothetical protein Ais01nite_82250 [Asanoa ishikariensis]